MRTVRNNSGFTLLEITAVVVILMVLGALVFQVSKRIPTLADKAVCVSNMRNLHGALSAYTIENQQWPQQPMFDPSQEAEMDKWWIETLSPYGMDAESSWHCPGIRRLGTISLAAEEGEPIIHYMPTMFDPRPSTPFRWKWQPWAVEIADVHGMGAHVLFQDGSVRTMRDLKAQ